MQPSDDRPEDDKAESAGPTLSAAGARPGQSLAEGETNPAERIIQRFGGLRPMANKLEIAVSTVQGWKARGQIPHARHADIRAAASRHGIALDEAELAAADSGGPKAAEARSEEGAAAAQRRPVATAVEAPAGESRGPEAPEAEAPLEDSLAPGNEIPAAEAPAVSPATRGGFLGGLLAGALAVLLTAVVLLFLRSYWLPLVEQRLPDSRYAELQQRLVQLENRLAAVSAGGDSGALRESLRTMEEEVGRLAQRLSAAEPGPRLEELGRRQDEQERRLGDLDARLGPLSGAAAAYGDLSRRLDETIARLAAVEEAARQARAMRAEDVAFALALVQLREALRFSEPYDTALFSLQRLAAEDREMAGLLAPLAAHAEAGVPTVETLRISFAAVAEQIAGIAYSAEETGWLKSLLRSLSDIVVVRPVGEVEGAGPVAVAARAEARLGAGDLKAAVSLLEGLEGAAAEAAGPWLVAARARLEAEAALEGLTRLAVTRLGTGG